MLVRTAHSFSSTFESENSSFCGAAFTDNASVNTYAVPGHKNLIAMTEATTGTFKVDVDSLETLGPVNYDDALEGSITTAHPAVFPDGSIYNLFSEVISTS